MANIFYNKTKLKNIRRVLRKQIISAEVIFWSKIRNKQQQYKFRRQYSVGNYVLDFYCPKLKLGVEIDGATHTTDQEINKDLKREQDIKLFGIKIIRFNNNDIYQNIEGVLTELYDQCKNREREIKITSPSPRLKIGGASLSFPDAAVGTRARRGTRNDKGD